jgi:hypothetical protein
MKLKQFAVYEVWTQARVIDAIDETDAYKKGEPAPRHDELSLCNWHIVEIPERVDVREIQPPTAGTVIKGLQPMGELRILLAEDGDES